MALAGTGAELNHITPRPTKSLWGDNYLSFDSASGGGTFAAQFLPEIYEKEVERYGKRTINGFLRMVGAEMPLASDQVIWSEQGRLHVAYDDGLTGEAVNILDASANTITVPSGHLIKNHDTIIVSHVTDSSKVLKCIVTNNATAATTITVAPYAQAALDTGSVFADGDNIKLFVYGTEYKKGSSGITGSIDASFTQFSNRPVIMRDRYQVNGSDTAQIGWVEVTTENGASGYLWYMKSEHEARLRFEDQIEMMMVEGEKAAATFAGTGNFAIQGTEGLFAAVEDRGIVYNNTDFDTVDTSGVTDQVAAGAHTGLDTFDTILQELDKQGAIEENMMFLNRATTLEIDKMLAAQNNYGVGGTSYGVFNNSENMALNLGFSGFRRGSYDFYKSDWKYLNDATTRGLIGDIEGIMVPAGTSTVYDQSLGKNISRPFLHVRYRASEADDRRMKSWITGSVGGNFTSDADEMVVNFLSERCLCVQAANNFVLFKKTT
tara:strand:+ start:429 stop:1904 length:1476 start_codon:yes stop_codon:yes gene_type:complete